MVDDLQGLEGAVGLRSLVLTFNELTSMEGLTCLTRLTCLDLSFNAISRIQALKVAPFTPASANDGMHVAYAFSPHMLSLLICFLSSYAFSPCNPICGVYACFLVLSYKAPPCL